MKIMVPASSANLGPGFDCYGLAWDLFNTFEFYPADSLLITGCPAEYANENNLAYRGFRAVLTGEKKCAEATVPGVHIHFSETRIPISRGLGSSSALIVAGVLAADSLYHLNLSREKLLFYATEVEGHPDNVTPALMGGFTISVKEGEQIHSEPFPVSEKLYFTALIPDFELSTSLCRSVLPNEYRREDAVYNVSHSAYLLKALQTGDASLLEVGLRDRIHEPYRKALISGYDTALEIAQAGGAQGFCISGAGPTLLAISDSPDCAEKIRKKVASELPAWKILRLKPDFVGARIIG